MKEVGKAIPSGSFVRRALDARRARRLKSKSTEETFTRIYQHNEFRGKESVSGPGSDSYQTRIVARELPALFSRFGISSLLDIPCGDFHWMKNVDLGPVDYTGADVVRELVQANTGKYARDGVRFRCLNLITDRLPGADLILCRDCLGHFSSSDIFLALNNICRGRSVYFLATTFTSPRRNEDIATGLWRAVNLELAPFELPKPLAIINEGCTEDGGIYRDKALGLWKIADIRKAVKRMSLESRGCP